MKTVSRKDGTDKTAEQVTVITLTAKNAKAVKVAAAVFGMTPEAFVNNWMLDTQLDSLTDSASGAMRDMMDHAEFDTDQEKSDAFERLARFEAEARSMAIA